MSTKPLIAVAAVTAVLAVSAGFPIGQSATGLGAGVASASPCPPFLPCQGPPKPPKLPDFGGGPGAKGPKLPDFGGGPGAKGPKLPDFGGGPGAKGPKLPDFGGGPGAKGPNLPDFGGGPGLKGPKLAGPGDVRRAFTAGGPAAGVRLNVPGAVRVPKDFRPDFPAPRARPGQTESRRSHQLPLARWPRGTPAWGLQGQRALADPTAPRPRSQLPLALARTSAWRFPQRFPLARVAGRPTGRVPRGSPH
jgi:hypothetical protein